MENKRAFNFKDLSGKVFSNLTVIELDCISNGQAKWKCKCTCGVICSKLGSHLRSGSIKTCGKCNKIEDLTGRKFGKLTALEYVKRDKNNLPIWLCECECGNIKEIQSYTLTSRGQISCGCMAGIRHNMYNKKIYKLWDNIKKRCRGTNKQYKKDYYDRGITVCEEWVNDINSFVEWAYNNGYSEEKTESGRVKYTIDRIDNNKGYSPDNCRFVINDVQQRNRRNNKYAEYIDGYIYCFVDIAKLIGINPRRISECIRKNNFPYKIFTYSELIENNILDKVKMII